MMKNMSYKTTKNTSPPRIPYTPTPPVKMKTGRILESGKKFLELGFTDCITKPFDLYKLIRIANKHLYGGASAG